MKIEEKDFENYFPRNMRFLHYCAKYYGMSFYNDEVVYMANAEAFDNVMKMHRDQRVFETEAEKIGIVMSAFRFGILNAYTKKRNQDRLDVRNESQLTYGDGDEEYNKYLASATHSDKEYDNLMDKIIKFIDNDLTHPERLVVRGNILEGKTYANISNNNDISESGLRNARERALNKLRRYVKGVTSIDHTKESDINKRRYVSWADSQLRIQALLKDINERKNKEERYSSAMSYVHFNE